MQGKRLIGSWRNAVVLALVASVALAGCDLGSPTPTPILLSPTPAPTQEAVAGPQLNRDLAGNIEMWHFWSSPLRRNAIRRVIAICGEQLPNIEVTETARPFADIWTANAAAVAAGSGMPDVIVSDRIKLPEDAAQKIYTNLQEWADRDGVKGEAFWPFAWQQTLYQGDTYGIPFETDVRVLYYNKNAFKEVGLDPEKPPKTWAELEEYAAKLDKKAADGSYERLGFAPLEGNASPEFWGYANDVDWITEDGKVEINTPRAVETLNFVKKWIDRYGGWDNYKKIRTGFQSPPNDAFMSGKVAMLVHINGYASQLNFYNPQIDKPDGSGRERLDWGVSDMPYNTSKGSWSGGFAMSIPRGAQNPEPAWEFIKCATGEEGAVSWSRDTYAMSAHVQAARDPALVSDPVWSFFLQAMEYSTGGNRLEEYPGWGEQLTQRYEKVWTGEMTAEQALQEAQAAVEAEVNK
jgi:multiple sugar transport system substrate-binding protein